MENVPMERLSSAVVTAAVRFIQDLPMKHPKHPKLAHHHLCHNHCGRWSNLSAEQKKNLITPNQFCNNALSWGKFWLWVKPHGVQPFELPKVCLCGQDPH